MALLQLVPSAINWTIVGTIVYVLMPTGADVTYTEVVSVFLLGAVAGLIVRVPAGLGVLEAAFLWTLVPKVSAAAVVASLLAYRVIYFIVPLVCGIVAAVGAEFLFRSRPAKQAMRVNRSAADRVYSP